MSDINANAIADYGYYLGAEAGWNLPQIEEQARNEGLSTDGFEPSEFCVLKPLGEVIHDVADPLVAQAFNQMQLKLCNFGDGVMAAAKHYGATEAANVGLFQMNGLSSDGTDVTFSHGDAKSEDSDYYRKGGNATFKIADLDLTPPSRDGANPSDEMDGAYKAIIKFLDWVWSTANVDDGKNFEQSMIEPLFGNFASIKANGEAWRSVGKNLGLVATQMGTNGTKLFTDYWLDSDAAHAAEHFLDYYWTKGCAKAGEKVGDFVAQGFDKIAGVIPKLITACINGIKTLVTMIANQIATDAVPGVSEIVEGCKVIADFFGIDANSIIDKVKTAIAIAKAVIEAYNAIKELNDALKAYFNTAQELIDVIQKIPDIHSLTDAAKVTTDGADAYKAYGEAAQNVDKKNTEAGKKLTDLDTKVNDATGALSNAENS